MESNSVRVKAKARPMHSKSPFGEREDHAGASEREALGGSNVGVACPSGGHVMLAGAGNIGTHLVPLAARCPMISSLSIIDPDSFCVDNLPHQGITRSMIGCAKAKAMAKLARQIAPGKQFTAWVEPIEQVPLGLLAGSVLVVAVDNRSSRVAAHRMAWQLGLPSVDVAVDPRVNVIALSVNMPRPGGGCFECPMAGAGYRDAVGQHHSCVPGLALPSSPPTRAPAELGALAAIFAMDEVLRLLRQDWSHIGQTRLFDANQHTEFVSHITRRSDCRFDHDVWTLVPTPIDEKTSLDVLLAEVSEDVQISVPNRPFVRALQCPGCKRKKRVLALHDATSQRGPHRCAACGHSMEIASWHLRDRIAIKNLTEGERRRPLNQLGLRSQDIVVIERPDAPPRRLVLQPTSSTDLGCTCSLSVQRAEGGAA